MRIAENKSRRVGMKFEAWVVMRLAKNEPAMFEAQVEFSNSDDSGLETIHRSGAQRTGTYLSFAIVSCSRSNTASYIFGSLPA
ncbi:MAG: hypothetical protein JW925_07565, partial [Syntrophaceae bacterium]|nr:hypothetical protein [Syntrophaceae bacterium]